MLLGRWRGNYLRHDGPEHVLCFAPTRTGKGVGLVVPTLLTWPGSAIVHDIKGENWSLTAGWRARFGRVLLFDPTNTESAAYNPLLEVRRGEWEVARRPEHRRRAGRSRRRAGKTEPLGEDEPFAAGRHHPACPLRREGQALAGVANFLSDPKRPIEATLRAMMTTPHLGEEAYILSSPAPRESC